MGGARNTHGGDHLRDLSVHGRLLRKQDERVWIGVIWLRIVSSGWLL